MEDLSADDKTISAKIINYESLLHTSVVISDIDKLLQEEAILSDKLTSLGSVSEHHQYTDDLPKQLEKYEKTLLRPPQYDLEYYRKKLEEIKIWKNTHKLILCMTLPQIKSEIARISEKVQTLNHEYSTLVDNKPNQPEITIDDYDKFKKIVNDTTQSIKQLDKPFNNIDALRLHCIDNPLPIIDNKKSIKVLQKNLSDGLSKLLYLSWHTDPLETLEQLLKTYQCTYDEKNVLFEQHQQELDNIDRTMASISKEIDEIDDSLATLGIICKPSISQFDIDKWLENFAILTKQLDDKQKLLTRLEEQKKTTIDNINQYSMNTNKLDLISREINEIEQKKIPFNPNCSACRQQVWKLRHIKLIEEQTLIQNWIKNNPITCDIKIIHSQINTTSDWLNNYDSLQKQVNNYNKMKQNWNNFNKNNGLFNSLKNSKLRKQSTISELKKKKMDITTNLKQFEIDKRDTQKIITGLHYAINNRPTWILLQQQINNIEKWSKEHRLHSIFDKYEQLDFIFYEKQKTLLDQMNRWKNNVECNRQTLKTNTDLLDNLNDRLSIIEENVTFSEQESDYYKQINNWTTFIEINNKILTLKHIILLHKLSEIKAKIKEINDIRNYQQNLQYWKNIATNKLSFIKKQQVNTEIDTLSQSIQQLIITYERTKMIYDNDIKKSALIEQYNTLIAKLTTKKEAIEIIHKLMSNYRIWLYTNIIIPQITKMINHTANIVTECSDYALEGKVSTKRNMIDISWSIIGPSGVSCIEKSGGFRKYIYGLIMRISLTRMGCSHINNSQLFIDEGFVASDSYNLEKMPNFLRNLLEFYPNGIILVSHLHTIRDCADITINIERNQKDCTSLIQFNDTPPTVSINKPKMNLLLKTRINDVASGSTPNKLNNPDNNKRASRNSIFARLSQNSFLHSPNVSI